MENNMTNPEYRNRRREKLHPFNFEISLEDREKLKSVATYRAISMAATLRQLIRSTYEMQLQGRPKCANGHDCFMPHLHPSNRPTPPQEDPRS